MIERKIRELEGNGVIIPEELKVMVINREKGIDAMDLTNIQNDICKRSNIDMFLIQLEIYNETGNIVF